MSNQQQPKSSRSKSKEKPTATAKTSDGGRSGGNTFDGGRRPKPVTPAPGNHSGTEAKTKSGKYTFHPDYLQASQNNGQSSEVPKSPKAKKAGKKKLPTHPREDDDEFWDKKYGLVNYKKKFPEHFVQEEFEELYEFLTNTNTNDLNDTASILFKSKQKVDK